ncbi:DEAD/DEAH box helicase [Candidatus Thiothrix sp. Deng01]|uniref:DEAD/DEAH box helicase n=1 Tax=Candidatus Thiothrix phosphatis TaxID=3112415 RepID=A0ABU6CWY9_9GAMM|nr:DEAD/DEAH box helicase [Candidatus Thiothrix sp. Deng01]MEB4591356.1 DEAD/DEAH box helicase [Candidatus Thiothrix sp. Deng01]
MDICHGTWVPASNSDFNNQGQFIFWVETPAQPRSKVKEGIHPNHLSKNTALGDFLTSVLSLSKATLLALQPKPAIFYATLPTHAELPLPSLEMAQLTGEFLPDECSWQTWAINGKVINQPLLFLRELQFIASMGQPGFRLGSDLLFWVQYAQQLRNMIRQHQFLPVMKCRQPAGKKARLSIETGWSPVGSLYERGLQDFAAAMPGICTTISNQPPPQTSASNHPDNWEALALLRHFSEQQLEGLVTSAKFTKQVLQQLGDSWLLDAAGYTVSGVHKMPNTDSGLTAGDWQQWYAWQRGIVGKTQDAGFALGLRLQPADNRPDTDWWLGFFVESSQDPSLKMDLSDWWTLSSAKQKQWQQHFGPQFERNLLVNMGHAARMCPLLWQGMESSQPTGVSLDLPTAYEFLKNDAAVLEAAGFRIALPSWWTPQGRKRARIRIKASGRSASAQEKNSGTGYFSLPSLVQYHYELAVGGDAVTEQEWQALVNAKTPLVQFRGEWMELDSAQMEQLLALWRQQEQDGVDASVSDLLKQVAEADDNTTEFVFDEVLDRVLQGLQQQRGIEPLDNPVGLRGQLRAYQKQGLSWLAAQESLGLNPCLADDMGLGKTIQVIALLLHERNQLTEQQRAVLPPTLLIAPTSVLSNWQKEMEKFSPQLRSLIHHGSDRADKPKPFKDAVATHDVVITSFTIARKDSALFKQQAWQRIVVDEAQNIKNPKSAQAKAIYALEAPHRIAMTGTPIENRLMDMWSLFHFLNPGYLGNATQFKRAYETPIQREGDTQRSRQLQRLVQPFILRRLKTDRSIITDLPDKVEQKVYCNLTKEQASLYQAVVDDVQQQLEEVEGIQRKGLILATLMKLKQICNHPAQFLQDGSSFSEARSHKLTRLAEMVEEALEESDSLLLFTQFTEVGEQLEKLLRGKYASPVYYLHGGTSRKHREQMIDSFQDPDTPAGIFILSLKAGGVGITLTQANHVFHFDRWWNPAVENQATDRAYRIGQQKTVFAHKMVTLGTLEERIDKMLEDKQALADSIIGTDENWLTEMDNAAFRQLIQLNRATILEA